MISLELRKRIELWSFIATLFIMIIGFILFVFLYVTTARVEGRSEMIQTSTVKYEAFGIVTSEDIYQGKELDMSKYTSHGRLKKPEE